MVLQSWFQAEIQSKFAAEESTKGSSKKVPAPQKSSSSKKVAPKETAKDTASKKLSKQAVEKAADVTDPPEPVAGEIEEEPSYLARIIILQQEWLDLILEGSKVMELRKSSLRSEAGAFYLAAGNTLHGRCEMSPPISIDGLDQFKKLESEHKCKDPFYTFPCVGHRISKLQKIKPLEFCKLKGCVGRSLYRPVGWTEELEKEMGKAEEPKKGTKTGTTNKANQNTQQPNIKTLSAESLKGQKVEVLDAQKYLCPSKERFEAKQEFLKRKSRPIELHISGGLLAHLNNEAFARAPASTGGYLLGSKDEGDPSVSALWVPTWEHQASMCTWQLGGKELEEWAAGLDLQLVGACLVVPNGDRAEVQHLEVFNALVKKVCEDFILILTGKDRMSNCYRPQGGTMKPVEMEVHWTGNYSLYRAKVLSKELEIMQEIGDAARKMVEDFRKAPLKKRKELEAERNAKRRAKPGTEDSESSETVLGNLRNACAQLEELSDFLVENLSGFSDSGQTAADFRDLLQKKAYANVELSKLGLEPPTDVSSAGKCLASTLNLKAVLEEKCRRRIANDSHTYNGNKRLGTT